MATEIVVAVKYVGDAVLELEYDGYPGIYKPGEVYLRDAGQAKFLLSYRPIGKPKPFVRVEVPKTLTKEAARIEAEYAAKNQGVLVSVRNKAKKEVVGEWDGVPYVFAAGETKPNIPIDVAKNLCFRTLITTGKEIDKVTKKEKTLVVKPLVIVEPETGKEENPEPETGKE